MWNPQNVENLAAKIDESFVSYKQITPHLQNLMKALTAEHLSLEFRPLTFHDKNLKERLGAMTTRIPGYQTEGLDT